MTAWYNEIDPRAANTLEELIAAGEIAPGVVDRRPIQAVRAEDLRGFTQCHFFAGIGVWSHALRRAGWPDDRPGWTGSCPCQPFSLAGSGRGFDDPRHLWPFWVRLIEECRPGRIFGEQVASADQWLDLVAADLEDLDFAFAAPDLAAAGFAGAHIRQRFFWVADAYDAEWWADHAPRHIGDWPAAGRLESYGDAAGRGAPDGVGHADEGRGGRDTGGIPSPQGSLGRGLRGLADSIEPTGPAGWLGDAPGAQWEEIPWAPGAGARRLHERSAAASGADWLLCRDATWRPVEPGTFPLAVEAPARVGRLHGYGNAIDAETCAQFLSAYIAAAENRP